MIPVLGICVLAAFGAAANEREPVALGSLPGDIGETFGRLFDWNQVLPAAAIAGAIGFASIFDDEVREYFGPTERLGTTGDVVSHPAVLSGAFGSVIVSSWLLESERHRRMTYDLIQGLLVTNAITFGVKLGVRRERPDGGNFAFPSGHGSNTFTIAAIMGRHYGWRAAIPLHALALLVSLARLDNDSHWVSDSVAGAGIGLLVGHTIVGEGKLPSPTSRLSWTPVFGASTVGVQFALALGPD